MLAPAARRVPPASPATTQPSWSRPAQPMMPRAGPPATAPRAAATIARAATAGMKTVQPTASPETGPDDDQVGGGGGDHAAQGCEQSQAEDGHAQLPPVGGEDDQQRG